MKKYMLIAVAVVVILLAGAFVYFSRNKKEPESAPAAPVEIPDLNPVNKTNPFTNIKTNPFE